MAQIPSTAAEDFAHQATDKQPPTGLIAKQAEADYEGFFWAARNEVRDLETLHWGGRQETAYFKWFADALLNLPGLFPGPQHQARPGRQDGADLRADDGGVTHINYRDLLAYQIANGLRSLGIARVTRW